MRGCLARRRLLLRSSSSVCTCRESFAWQSMECAAWTIAILQLSKRIQSLTCFSKTLSNLNYAGAIACANANMETSLIEVLQRGKVSRVEGLVSGMPFENLNPNSARLDALSWILRSSAFYFPEHHAWEALVFGCFLYFFVSAALQWVMEMFVALPLVQFHVVCNMVLRAHGFPLASQGKYSLVLSEHIMHVAQFYKRCDFIGSWKGANYSLFEILLSHALSMPRSILNSMRCTKTSSVKQRRFTKMVHLQRRQDLTIWPNWLNNQARDVLRVLPPEHIFEDAEIIGIRFPEFDEATARVHQSPRAIWTEVKSSLLIEIFGDSSKVHEIS